MKEEHVSDGESGLPADLKFEYPRAITEGKIQRIRNSSKNADYFKLLKSQKKRSELLENIYKAFLTVKPTSVESLRAFLTSGSFFHKDSFKNVRRWSLSTCSYEMVI